MSQPQPADVAVETNPNPTPRKKKRKVYRKSADGKIFNTIDSIKEAEAAKPAPEPLPFDEVQISPRRWIRRREGGAAVTGKDPLGNASTSKASTDRVAEEEQQDEDEDEEGEDVDSDEEVGFEDDDSFASSRYSVLSELTASVAASAKGDALQRVPTSIGPRSPKTDSPARKSAADPLSLSNGKGETREAAALEAAAAAGAAAASTPHPYESRSSLDAEEERMNGEVDGSPDAIMRVSTNGTSPRTPTVTPMPQVKEEDGLPLGKAATKDVAANATSGPTLTGYTPGSQTSNLNSVGTRFSQEQIQTLQNEVQQSRKAKRRMCLILALVTVFFIVGIVVVVLIFVTRDGSDESTPVPPAPSTDAPAVPTTSPAAVTPTKQPSMNPTEEGATNEPTQNLPPIQEFFMDASPDTSFEDPDSPQSLALEWMDAEAYNQEIYHDNYNENPYRIVQRFTLGILYYAQGGSGDGNLWLTETPECDWKGVECGGDAMTSLRLFDQDLDGTIADEIGLLTELVNIHMGLNDLKNTIPTSLGALTKLTSVQLPQNQLIGTLPSGLITLTALERFVADTNPLEGELPEGMGEWTNLTSFSVRDTQIEGPLPDLSRLTKLRSLFLYNTDLSGTLPISLCDTLQNARVDCGEVECACCTPPCDTPSPSAMPSSAEPTAPTNSPTLDSSETEYIKTVIQQRSPKTDFDNEDSPASLALAWIVQDDFSKAQIRDNIDKVVERFGLATIYYSTGGDSWNRPSSTGWLEATDECEDWMGVACDDQGRIASLALDAVNLINLLPTEMGLLSQLRSGSFRNNQLGAPLPIDSMLQLTHLDLTSNTLADSEIPPDVGSMSNLRTLLMSDCGLVGNVPRRFNRLVRLEHLDLSRNDLEGELPDFSSLTTLTRLELYDNEFTGILEAPCATLTEGALVDCAKVSCSCCQSSDGAPCGP